MLIGIATLLVARTAASQATAGSVRADTGVWSLRALVLTALKNNLTLRAAEQLPKFAGADLLAVRSSFDPSLTLGVDNDNRGSDVLGTSPRTNRSTVENSATVAGVFPFGTQLSLALKGGKLTADPFTASTSQPFPTSHASSLGISFTQPLLRGFGRTGSYGAVDAAVTSLEAARRRYERSADLAVALVEQAYWSLRQAESDELASIQSVTAARAIYDRSVALQQRDVATALDVLTSERGLATRETQQIDATRRRVDAADRLLFLVYGEEAANRATAPAGALHTARDSLRIPAIPSLGDAETLALSQRGDATGARRDVEAARRLADQSRNLRRPRLDFVAAYAYGGTAASAGFLNYGNSGDVRSSTFSWGLSTSLYQHNDAAVAVDQRALSELELARLTQLSIENVVRADVRAAVRALQAGRDRYLRAADVGRLAEREYALALDGSRLGLISTFQLLQYEGALADARLLVSQARFALESAGTAYRLAVGEGRREYGEPPSGASR